MHCLLEQQLERFYGSHPNLPAGLAALLAAVNESYESFERARELSERKLREANSEMCAVFEAIPDVILRLDCHGATVALKATEQATDDPDAPRFSKRQIISNIANIPDPVIRGKYERALGEMLRDRQPKVFEYSISSELGESFFEVRLMPLLETDAIAIVQDISRRKEREADSRRLNQELITASRQAGMAEVATGVLHNVGNVLNSVNVAATLLRENLRKSQLQHLFKATDLLRDHAADLTGFLTTDPRGQRLPGFLIKLSEYLATEKLGWQAELDGLGKNIEHIKEIVAMQQSYARLSGGTEAMKARKLVEDALRMTESSLVRDGVAVVRDFRNVPQVAVDKHKVLQILVNLIRNSKHALDKSGPREKTLTVSIRSEVDAVVKIEIRDNGIGIAPENLTRVFQHGFTTKREGHGFGLHSSANAAREMGGNLTAYSDGPGHGASFVLELPEAKIAEKQETHFQKL